jgi:hypothetical protein
LHTLQAFLKAEAPRPLLEAEPSASLADSVGGWMRELVAQLLPATPATALRGEVTQSIMAEADGLTIILTPQAAQSGRLVVLGQIAAEDQDRWVDAVVQVRRDGELLATATVNYLGAFRCEGIEAGPAQLRLTPRIGSPVRVSDLHLSA